MPLLLFSFHESGEGYLRCIFWCTVQACQIEKRQYQSEFTYCLRAYNAKR